MKSRGKIAGFTLIELLVVVAIIGILSSVVLASLSESRASSRDATRVQNLRSMQSALEIYYNDNGQYPDTDGQWFGGCDPSDGSWEDVRGYGANGYIPGLVPEYTPRLPADPRCGEVYNDDRYSTDFLYRSNGRNYVLLSWQSIESFNPNPSDKDHALDRPGHNEQSLGVYSDVSEYSNEAGW